MRADAPTTAGHTGNQLDFDADMVDSCWNVEFLGAPPLSPNLKAANSHPKY